MESQPSSCFPAVPSQEPPGTDPDSVGLIHEVEKEFSTLVIRARTAIRRRALSIHPDLQPLGFKVLSILVREHSRHQVGLAEELEVDKATMSRTIKQLECQGLVERVSDPADGRAMLVSITESARSRFSASGSRSRSMLRERLATWDTEEIRLFSELLSRLNVSDVLRQDD